MNSPKAVRSSVNVSNNVEQATVRRCGILVMSFAGVGGKFRQTKITSCASRLRVDHNSDVPRELCKLSIYQAAILRQQSGPCFLIFLLTNALTNAVLPGVFNWASVATLTSGGGAME